MRYWSSSWVRKHWKMRVKFLHTWVCPALGWGGFESLISSLELIADMELDKRDELESHWKGHRSLTYSNWVSYDELAVWYWSFYFAPRRNILDIERLPYFLFLGMLTTYIVSKVYWEYSLRLIIFHEFQTKVIESIVVSDGTMSPEGRSASELTEFSWLSNLKYVHALVFVYYLNRIVGNIMCPACRRCPSC